MVSKAKLYLQLDRLEDELSDRLIPHLENAIAGNNELVFCATGFSSTTQLKSGPDIETDELIQIGRQILALRDKLGEPSERTIAVRICWYCRKWADTDNGNGQSVQTFALALLEEVTNAKTKT